ncbi:esterase family protein [Staphylococcus pragensis]|uniref:Esterase family protein n=1 Tax=Staphylococcus pragensis TaxID=1611836 RepID=A0A4Z1BGU7_9STAP|nr:alpha/beta hydrolase family protein [Staphylococcus pragensis]RTX89686.1 esterase family protein [Staphylococcus carnosus]TGN24640.1 esterase family protein [Staphylococcus pragensis]GGG95998.1 tributyrin esterase [Staphylococcus pragensis]
MALMTINYKSPTIGMNQSFMAIIPEDDSFFSRSQSAKPLKTLLLLHGLSSDATSYTRFTSIERYAEEHQLAVIMPNADHSGYANMTYGHSYYDYILEIYNYAHQVFPLSTKREDNFIAGHSMGGYGTMKFVLTQSELFSKAAPLSAVFEAQGLIDLEWTDFSPQAVTGQDTTFKGTELDTYHLVDEAVENGVDLPQLLIQCGTEDFLYDDNQQFMKYLDDKGIKYQYEEGPGDHDYAFWDKAIKRTIEWLVEE